MAQATETETTERTFDMQHDMLPSALRLVEKTNKRAAKLGVAPIEVEVGEPYVVTFTRNVDNDGNFIDDEVVTYMRVRLTLRGAVIRMPGGWSFGAAIEVLDRDEAGKALCMIRGPRSADCIDLRESEPACEHCHTSRRRNETYVLFDASGARKVVGSTCLHDFFGTSPDKAIEALNMFASVCSEFDDESYSGRGRGTPTVYLDTFMAHVVAMIAKDGYTNSARARERGIETTGARVWSWMTCSVPKVRAEMAKEYGPSDEHAALAAELRTMWAATAAKVEEQRTAGQTPDEWDWKLYLLNRLGVVTYNTVGIAAGACQGSLRAIAKGKEQAAIEQLGPSQFVGTVGERAEFAFAIDRVSVIEKDYGTMMLIAGRQEGTGNKVCYWTAAGGKTDFILGKTYKIRASIKSQDEHPKWGKQTWISRAMIAPKKLSKEEKKLSKQFSRLIQRMYARKHTKTFDPVRYDRWVDANAKLYDNT